MNDPASGSTLLQRLDGHLNPAARNALDALQQATLLADGRLYLVCGTLRDLVLEREPLDIDLAIEGADAPAIAERVGAAIEARVVVHQRFGTAKLSSRDFQFDIAGTRAETYAHPGSLPQVRPATLAQDLSRRDFAVNAFAMRLAPDPGEVVDPFHGIADIHDGLLRVLHERSFQDDATRMLRGVRYATRFGFKLQRDTEALLQRDLAYLKRISGPRLRRELALLFHESAAVDGVLLAQRLGILETIHPALRLREDVAARWRDAWQHRHPAPSDETGFCILADPRDAGTVASLTKWLHLTGRVQRALEQLVRLRGQSDKLAEAAGSPAAVVELLEHLPPSSVWAFSVLDGSKAGDVCRRYLAHWRFTRPLLSGDDLLALGVQPGTAVGEMLKQLRRAQLQVEGMTREQEVALVRAAVRGGGS